MYVQINVLQAYSIILVCCVCMCTGHEMKECTGEAKEKEGEFDEMANSSGLFEKQFIFIRLNVLREVKCTVQ